MADREPSRSKNSRWGRFSKVASLWVLLFLVPLVLIQLLDSRETGASLSYSQFNRELAKDNVERVTFMEGVAIEGELRTPIPGEQGVSVSTFRTQLPIRDPEALVARLEAANVSIGARP